MPLGPDPLSRLALGSRVAIRTRIAPSTGAGAAGQPTLTDTVGELVAADESTLTVATRRGEVVLQRARVTAARVIPPRPARRGAPHRSVTIADLQRLMVSGHPPVERDQLGGWLLRAAGGYTQRANSLLPVGDPGEPLDTAVHRARAWYAARDLPLRVQLPMPAGAIASDDPLARALIQQGSLPSPEVLVMTAATHDLLGAVSEAELAPGFSLVRSGTVTDDFLEGSEREAGPMRALARGVLAAGPDQAFWRVEGPGGATAGVARSPLHDGWAGLFGVSVAPGARRRGLARALTRQAALRARAHGIRSVYLQVEASNEPAVRLYREAGFTTHHTYCFLSED